MNADFVRLAHRKAIWAELQRLLLDKYVASDGPPKEEIICEEVPYSQKDVTNEAVLEVLEIIQQHELDENLEMKQYEFKKRKQPDAKRDEEPQRAADPDPDAPGPAPFTRIANGDGGARRVVVQPAAGEPVDAPRSVQEEGAPASDAERQPPPPPAGVADRKRAAASR